MKLGILAACALALAGIAGCEGGVEVRPEPVPVGVYSTDYYWNGGYEGDYWVYRDHEGHRFREARAEHERHAREHAMRHDEHEHHEEHH